ncbi:MAG: hypothetical protein FWE24_11550 [Defluviitaleaceae bacterium]|nr:hypothetical protein [Defluviitaleaceae bacterium]
MGFIKYILIGAVILVVLAFILSIPIIIAEVIYSYSPLLGLALISIPALIGFIVEYCRRPVTKFNKDIIAANDDAKITGNLVGLAKNEVYRCQKAFDAIAEEVARRKIWTPGDGPFIEKSSMSADIIRAHNLCLEIEAKIRQVKSGTEYIAASIEAKKEKEILQERMHKASTAMHERQMAIYSTNLERARNHDQYGRVDRDTLQMLNESDHKYLEQKEIHDRNKREIEGIDARLEANFGLSPLRESLDKALKTDRELREKQDSLPFLNPELEAKYTAAKDELEEAKGILAEYEQKIKTAKDTNLPETIKKAESVERKKRIPWILIQIGIYIGFLFVTFEIYNDNYWAGTDIWLYEMLNPAYIRNLLVLDFDSPLSGFMWLGIFSLAMIIHTYFMTVFWSKSTYRFLKEVWLIIFSMFLATTLYFFAVITLPEIRNPGGFEPFEIFPFGLLFILPAVIVCIVLSTVFYVHRYK